MNCPWASVFPRSASGPSTNCSAGPSSLGRSDPSPPRAVYSDMGWLHQIRVVLLLRYFDRQGGSGAVVGRVGFPRHRVQADAVVVGSR